MQTEFRNESTVDFSREENVRSMEEALAKVHSELGREVDLIIGGERVRTTDKIKSLNPSNPNEVVGLVSKANQELAQRAMDVASSTFESWRRVAPHARARILWRAASILRRRRLEMDAWMVLEAGKSWAEAEADTAEAIDFLEFYGREMVRLAETQPLTRLAGEDNELYYIPLGVGVVIPPWNFPCAIMAGMTSAAMVAGNTVVLKPASVTPVIAARFVEMLEEAGMPPGVVNFLPGPGSSVGDFLVGHPKTRFIAFTGSKETGLHINELAAKTAPGQVWIKRVVAEMGGKDSILVDSDTNLEEAAQAIVTSAFGYQGQKCSACSRAIIVESVYDQVLQKVVEKTKAITVGPVRDRKFGFGPIIDESAMKSILQYIDIGKKEGRLLTGGERVQPPGYFVQPTVIADIDPMARISQEEIFGPVLAVIKAKNFDHAIEIGNNTEFGLTGAVWSRNRARLEKAREDLHIGNLYLNRKCTGAMVGAHPFGGFNMSGTDSKAGGRDYLYLFTQAKCVSEKL